ncbi:MAG: hypothetical protein FJW35_00075 [Acidobacteria bacterium]|nr:hypothetical protein [Acidobacteriota bacterium]
MAGIGFELRKLTRRDDLLGVLQGTAHSALASTGPWLFTIVALAGIVLIGSNFVSREESFTFQLIVIYNFAFSLVMSAPVVLLITRLLADSIYVKQVERAPALFLFSLIVLFASQLLLVAPFYLLYVDLDAGARLAAMANFFLVTGVWVASVFLTALKDYRSVSASFAVGVTASLIGCAFLASRANVTGMLLGFNIGLAIIVFALAARIFAEYPYPVTGPLRWRMNAGRYWELALGGFIYNLAIWIDKWVMWLAPERKVLPSGMVSYPDYDSGMFLAYLSIVPAMAVFVFGVETDFFEKYLRFYREIQRHASYEAIRKYHGAIIRSLLRSMRNLSVLQGSICMVTILLAPMIFDLLGLSFTQIGIFRFGVLGALFHVLFLFTTIILSYFDLRRAALLLQLVFLSTNALFTWWSLQMGFAWYGYGYLLAAVVTFAVALLAAVHFIGRLPYQTFVRTNLSVQGR